nr:hypothetical protein [Bradyrhizobium zhanjiangense]
MLAAARIVHRRRSFADEGIGDVEQVVDRFLNHSDAAGLPIAERAHFEVAMGGLAAYLRELFDCSQRTALVPDRVAEQQHDGAEQRSGRSSSQCARNRQREDNDGEQAGKASSGLRLRERAQIHRRRHRFA